MTSQRKHPNIKEKQKQGGPSRREEGLKTTQAMMTLAQNRAQKVFLKLVEETVIPGTFVELSRYINPEIYEHVVLDRGASSVCGYPLCSNPFTDSYGEKTYKIRSNKIYDITMRRNFCSDVCYEASEIVKRQISLEPLYVRESRPDIICNVEIPSLESLQGLPGKFVDISGGLYSANIQNEMRPRPFTSFTEVAEDSLKMCAENKEVFDEENKTSETAKSDSRNGGKKKTVAKKPKVGTKKDCDKESEKENARGTTNYHNENLKNDERAESSTLNAVLQIEKAMREWTTFDTLRFVLGDRYVRGMLEDLGKNWEDFDTTAGMKLGVEAKSKYIALCRKLDEQERYDNFGREQEVQDVVNKAQNPLPDYKRLQEDAKKQQLKVVSFLGGKDQYEDDIASEKNAKAEEEDVCKASLPLIDSYAQVEWRQSIVLDKFDKYLMPFLPLTKLYESEVKRLIRDLVLTFDFTANNIIFKPGQWSLVTLLILNLLSIRYSAIQHGLGRQEFCEFRKTLLSSFNLDIGYLDRFIAFVTEVRHVIRKFDGSEEASAVEGKSGGHTPSFEENRLAESLGNMSVNCVDGRLPSTQRLSQVSETNEMLVNTVSSTTEELD